MKLIMTGIMATLLPLLSWAQVSIMQPLTIGDRVPYIIPCTVINYSLPTVKLSSFKNKLLILDFMNTYCLTCIKALPVFDSLQQKYKNKLQIFMVSDEHKPRATKFMQFNPVAKDVSIPFIINDTVLGKLFPHVFVSHEAWIYDGKVVAITSADYVTEKNILSILSGKTPNWPVKTDVGNYDYEAPLVIPKVTISGSNHFYHSACMPHLNGVATHYMDETDSSLGVRTIRVINYSIADLYLQAVVNKEHLQRSHVLLQQGNEDLFTYFDKNEYRNVWEEKNTYCYEATFPANIPDSIAGKKIKADLDAYLQVQSNFETIKTTGYLIVPDSGFTPLGGPIPNYTTLSLRAKEDQLIFMSVPLLVDKLNETFWSTPFFWDIPGGMDTPLILADKILTDLNILKDELKKQHLLLKEITKNVNMLILKKTSN